MALKGKPIAIGTSDTTIYTCPSTLEASVHGLVFSNNTGSAVTITLKIYIQSLGTTTTVATGISVGANTTYTWPKPINVNAGDLIQAAASTGSALVCFYSVYEGSAVAAAVGFTPRGAWGSGSTYAVNDVVSYNGSSYLAIQASTNQQPDTQTAYWLVLAAKGDTGSGDVTGPASSVDSEIAVFNSTTGKIKATSGVLSAATAGTDYVTPTGSETLTNKTLTNPSVNNYTEGVVAIGTVSSSNTLSLTNGTLQTATLTASTACTFTMPTATAGKSFVLLLKQAASTGNGTATFTGVKWGTAGAPTVTATAGKMDIFTFVADGTNWYGSVAAGFTP